MNKILKSGMMLALALLAMSCNKEDLPGNGEEVNGGALTINVVDKGYASQDSVPDTKATTDGSYKTTFGEGDEIGVYVVSGLEGNQILLNNEKLTYSGSGWTGDLRYKKIEGDSPKFFAYYPYDGSISSEKLTASASDAEGFFATYLSGITLPTDQSDAGKYSKADIMVGDGSLAGTALTFGMEHQMGLVVVELPTQAEQPCTYKLSTDASYTWEGVKMTSVSCTDVKLNSQNALLVDGKYRYLVKPGTEDLSGSFSMASESKTFTCTGSSAITAGSYKIYKVSVKLNTRGADEEHILKKGDLYMADGSILNGDLYSSETPIPNPEDCRGIVFSVKNPYDEDTNLDTKFTHGLVLALKDAGSYPKWSKSYDIDQGGIKNCQSLQDCKEDLVGYSNNKTIWEKGSPDAFPAFNVKENYTQTLPEGKTSGWFLPSIGQWIYILSNLGEANFTDSERIEGVSASAANKIDSYLDKVGGSYVQKIDYKSYRGTSFWSSSEYLNGFARTLNFISGGDGDLILSIGEKHNSTDRARYIFAF
ncbi:MAG: fimbrillin family protein [Parabacteroides sp.]|nr:fimbrillin family protein [Parabacteroides sp.]